MTDNHIHIGQFKDTYYDPVEIADIVLSSEIDGFSFSSTSSCIDNIEYREIEKEIKSFYSNTMYSEEMVRPFFWYIPEYIHQGISSENAFSEIAYKGIKIHPYVQNWDFGNTQHLGALHHLFEYAAQNNVPILIHTGHSGIDCADRFEDFIAEYEEASCVLAHCRPLDTTIKMLQKYDNAFCDTAFVPKEDVQIIIDSGFIDRILFGSDFPITHYFKTHYPQPDENPNITLAEQYAVDIADWETMLK